MYHGASICGHSDSGYRRRHRMVSMDRLLVVRHHWRWRQRSRSVCLAPSCSNCAALPCCWVAGWLAVPHIYCRGPSNACAGAEPPATAMAMQSPTSASDVPATSALKGNTCVYLQVSNDERMTVSVLGAKFDRERGAWYVPEELRLEPFRRWLPSVIAAARDRVPSVPLSPEERMRLYAQGSVSLRTLKRRHGIVGCECSFTRCLKK